MPRISIIVPVYNGQATILRCLDSICFQTVRDIEIIVINDGSTDRTGQLILEYAKKDNRITCFEQENKGQGYARNLGIEKAQGDYIGFVDADDTIDKNMYERMLSAIEKNHADIAQCNISLMRPDETVIMNRKAHSVSKIVDIQKDRNRYIDQYLSTAVHSYECCNKLIRRSLILKHSIFFESNTKVYAEDFLYNLDLTLYAIRIVFIKESLYHYYQYKQSHSSKICYDNIEQFYRLFEIFIKHSKDEGSFETLKFSVYKTAIFTIMNHASQTLKFDLLKYKINEILKRQDVSRYLNYLHKHAKRFNIRFFTFALLFFPIPLKCFYLKLYFKIKNRFI